MRTFIDFAHSTRFQKWKMDTRHFFCVTLRSASEKICVLKFCGNPERKIVANLREKQVFMILHVIC